MTQPWIEKYRPANLSEIVSQDPIIKSIDAFMAHGKIPHVIFHGESGTGKSTTAKCCISKLLGAYSNILSFQLNSSADRRVETIRTTVKSFLETSVYCPRLKGHPLPDPPITTKIILLEEIDSMTKDAQMLLSRLFDTRCHNTRIIMTCNMIEKVDQSLKSRCFVYRFMSLSPQSILPILNNIICQEDMQLTEGAVQTCLDSAQGDMRMSINLLQQSKTAFSNKLLTEEHIQCLCGESSLEEIFVIGRKLNLSGNTNKSILYYFDQLEKIMSKSQLDTSKVLLVLAKAAKEDERLTAKQKSKIIIQLASCQEYHAKGILPNILLFSLVSGYQLLD